MTAHSVQDKITLLLRQLVAEDRERGIQVAVYHRGKLVVDTWAGVADATTGQPVGGESLFPVFSVGKGMTATVVHRLVERGALDYETRLATVWPEFGVRGKENITLRHVLDHTAGLPQMPTGIGHREVCDWDAMCRALEGLSPLWPPGSHVSYHAMTFGWLVGEVARRVDGRSFPQLLHDEVCRPLGIETMFMGIPDAVEPRVARLDFIGSEACDPNAEVPDAIPAWVWPLTGWMNRPDVRRACVPASNGIMNARAIARHYAALIPGGVDGVELLPPARVRAATQWRDLSRVAGSAPTNRFALGYGIGGNSALYGPRSSVFGHGGYGGAAGFADPECELAVGVTKNLLGTGDPSPQIVTEVRRALGLPA
jgi:CubicO group peptidase (beta-lactamase class C family)